MRKYEYTGETRQIGTLTVKRIRAVKHFGDVKAGDEGGWIESKRNLSQYGNAWVSGNVVVCENARVFGNAVLHGSIVARGNATIYGDIEITGSVVICGNSMIHENNFGKQKFHGGMFKRKGGIVLK